MKPFEYAAPRTEAEAVGLLAADHVETEVLAGGTDLIGLMKQMVVTPGRLVNVKEIPSMQAISETSDGVVIGAAARLEDMAEHRLLTPFSSIGDAIVGIDSQQWQAQSTLGGELLQRPRCWYFRSGAGLLAANGKRVTEGDGRFHAIFANSGPAKFVNASRLAPALIALGASIRIMSPGKEDAEVQTLPLASLYRTPRDESQRENILSKGQLVTHVLIPHPQSLANATYEVRHGSGPEAPLVAASAALQVQAGLVAKARIVIGQVAPQPWESSEAAESLVGRPIDLVTAEQAGQLAVAAASPLKDNAYKVQLAAVAVKRAILKAAGLPTGGF
ncbi:MAG: FAD binding domain-containing protein [Pirellulales bacterium]|nr:FAD binding domain-containing protein [Pirellulales bacterium]